MKDFSDLRVSQALRSIKNRVKIVKIRPGQVERFILRVLKHHIRNPLILRIWHIFETGNKILKASLKNSRLTFRVQRNFLDGETNFTKEAEIDSSEIGTQNDHFRLHKTNKPFQNINYKARCSSYPEGPLRILRQFEILHLVFDKKRF